MAARCFLLCLAMLCATLVMADEVYRIGAEDDWYPFTALRDGEVQGMSADLVRAAFAASNTRVELVPYPYSRCMELTRTGQLAACFNTSPDTDIAREYRLPEEPLFSDDILLWARREDARPLADLQQLVGQKVAVTIGYEYGAAFDSLQGVERVGAATSTAFACWHTAGSPTPRPIAASPPRCSTNMRNWPASSKRWPPCTARSCSSPSPAITRRQSCC
jgi:polar amino acid transport system substrate-binding protein